jgi:hypothetical protein
MIRKGWLSSQSGGKSRSEVCGPMTSATPVSRHRRHLSVGVSVDMGRYLVEAHLREGRPVAELAVALRRGAGGSRIHVAVVPGRPRERRVRSDRPSIGRMSGALGDLPRERNTGCRLALVEARGEDPRGKGESRCTGVPLRVPLRMVTQGRWWSWWSALSRGSTGLPCCGNGSGRTRNA